MATKEAEVIINAAKEKTVSEILIIVAHVYEQYNFMRSCICPLSSSGTATRVGGHFAKYRGTEENFI
jgi:hypothetical protein